MVLNLDQLIYACQAVIDAATAYQPLLATAYQVQQQTGAREAEVLALDRWLDNGDRTYTLLTLKGSSPRIISASVLPPAFIKWLTTYTGRHAPTSVANMRRYWGVACPFGQLTVGSKGISTHTYRHTYAKTRIAQGLTIEQLVADMGLSSNRIAKGYVQSQVTRQK